MEWNSETGRVRGIITKKVTSNVNFYGYVHHASKAEPQYFIRSDKTDHVAVHKGGALKLLPQARKRKVQSSLERRKANLRHT